MTNHLRDYHSKILSEYHFNELTPPPENVARLDESYKGISKILDHKFSHVRKLKTDLSLLILWDDAIEPEWTPWNKSLGDEETVHRYLNDNFMARFIPKKYTWNKDHPNYEQPAWFSRKKAKN